MGNLIKESCKRIFQDHSISLEGDHRGQTQVTLEAFRDLAKEVAINPYAGRAFNIIYPTYNPEGGLVQFVANKDFTETVLTSHLLWEARFGCHQLTSLRLPNQELYSYDSFAAHPLFKHAKEKAEVYLSLVELSKLASFQDDYAAFLSQIQQDDWFSFCQADPIGFAKISLIAFLSGDIQADELAVIHTAAEAARELKEGNVKEASVHLDFKENAAEFFKEAHQPPFSTPAKVPMVNCHKTEEELEEIKGHILDRIDQEKKVLLRSVVTYRVASFLEAKRLAPIEFVFYNYANGRERLLNPSYDEQGRIQEATTALFPPALGFELYNALGQVPMEAPPERMFGYAGDIRSILESGNRVVSSASPLFDVPYVHNQPRVIDKKVNGAHRLALQMHDENYHVPLEMNNVHRKRLIELSQQLRDPSLAEGNRLWSEAFNTYADGILDRDIYMYRGVEPTEANFYEFLASAFKSAAFESLFDRYEAYKNWREKALLPALKACLGDLPKEFMAELASYHQECLSEFFIGKKDPQQVFEGLEVLIYYWDFGITQEFDAALAKQKTNSFDKNQKAIKWFLSEGALEVAVRFVREISAKSSGHWQLIVDHCLEQGDPEKALEVAREMPKEYRWNPLRDIVKYHLNKGDPEKALEAVMEMREDHRRCDLENIAKYHLNKGDPEKVVEMTAVVKGSWLWRPLADYYLGKGDLEQALAAASKISVDSRYWESKLAEDYLKKNQPEMALTIMERVAFSDSEKRSLRTKIMQYYLDKGDKEKASAMEKTIEIPGGGHKKEDPLKEAEQQVSSSH
ncbi:MAG: hypothetical protein FJZ63_03155 [Chlamydiae bacterium]|nr:hypothetical protein [Chlamydiota bacterium]